MRGYGMIDNFKIENFHREYPDMAFPAYRVSSQSEVDSIGNTLQANLSIDLHSAYAYYLAAKNGAVCVEGVNANSDLHFDLSALFRQLGIHCSETINICWCQIQSHEVGQMLLKNLCQYWDDIWYPNDDVLLFDQTCSWILGIDADGIVYYLSANREHF